MDLWCDHHPDIREGRKPMSSQCADRQCKGGSIEMQCVLELGVVGLPREGKGWGVPTLHRVEHCSVEG